MISIIQFIHEDSEYDDLVTEAFSQRAKMAATGIGSAIATALAATWSIKNKDEIAKYVDTITAKLGPEYNGKVIKYIRNLFGLNDLDSASEKLKRLAAERAEEMKKEIDMELSDTRKTVDKYSNLINKTEEAKMKVKKFMKSLGIGERRYMNDLL